ncbi:hypothetical protein ACFL08_04005 [Patescibacteria group bacterium]
MSFDFENDKLENKSPFGYSNSCTTYLNTTVQVDKLQEGNVPEEIKHEFGLASSNSKK